MPPRPACASQMILLAQGLLAAALRGASASQLDGIFEAMLPIVTALHGRLSLNLYLKHQVVAAVLESRPPLSYVAFLRERVAAQEESLACHDREHARIFLQTGELPPHYWRKLGVLAAPLPARLT